MDSRVEIPRCIANRYGCTELQWCPEDCRYYMIVWEDMFGKHFPVAIGTVLYEDVQCELQMYEDELRLADEAAQADYDYWLTCYEDMLWMNQNS